MDTISSLVEKIGISGGFPCSILVQVKKLIKIMMEPNNLKEKEKILYEMNKRNILSLLKKLLNESSNKEYNNGELLKVISEAIFLYVNNVTIFSGDDNFLFFGIWDMESRSITLEGLMESMIIENDNVLSTFTNLLNSYCHIIRKFIALKDQKKIISHISFLNSLFSVYMNNSEVIFSLINAIFDLICGYELFSFLSKKEINTLIEQIMFLTPSHYKNDEIITQCFSIIMYYIEKIQWSIEFLKTNDNLLSMILIFFHVDERQKNLFTLGKILEKLINVETLINYIKSDLIFFETNDFVRKDYEQNKNNKKISDMNSLFMLYLIMIQNTKIYTNLFLEAHADDCFLKLIANPEKFNFDLTKKEEREKKDKLMYYIVFMLCNFLMVKPSLNESIFKIMITNFKNNTKVVKLVCKSLISLSNTNENIFKELFFEKGTNVIEEMFAELLELYYDQYWFLEFLSNIKETDIYSTDYISQVSLSFYEMDFEKNKIENILYKFTLKPANKVITSDEMINSIKAYTDIKIDNLIEVCEKEEDISKDNIEQFNKFTLFLFTMMMNKDLCYKQDKCGPIANLFQAFSLLSDDNFEKLRKTTIIHNIVKQMNILYTHSNVRNESIIELSSQEDLLCFILRILETKDKGLIDFVFPTLICVIDINSQFKDFVSFNGLSLLISLISNEVVYEKNSVSSILRDITKKYIINKNNQHILIDNMSDFSFTGLCNSVRAINMNNYKIRQNDYHSMIYFFSELVMLLLSCTQTKCNVNQILEENWIITYLINEIHSSYLKESSFFILSSKNDNNSIFKQTLSLLTKLSFYEQNIKFIANNKLINFIEVLLSNEGEHNLLFTITNISHIFINILKNKIFGKWLIINPLFITMFGKFKKYIINNNKIIGNNLYGFYDLFDLIIELENNEWNKNPLIPQEFVFELREGYILAQKEGSISRPSNTSDDINTIAKEQQIQLNLSERIFTSLSLVSGLETDIGTQGQDIAIQTIPVSRLKCMQSIYKIKNVPLKKKESSKELVIKTINIEVNKQKKKRTKSIVVKDDSEFSLCYLITEMNKIIQKLLIKQREEDCQKIIEIIKAIAHLSKKEKLMDYLLNTQIIEKIIEIINSDYFNSTIQENTYKLFIKLIKHDKKRKIEEKIKKNKKSLESFLKEFNKITIYCSNELSPLMEVKIFIYTLIVSKLIQEKQFYINYRNYIQLKDIINALTILNEEKRITKNLLVISKFLLNYELENNQMDIDQNLEESMSKFCSVIFNIIYNKDDIDFIDNTQKNKEILQIFNTLVEIVVNIHSSAAFMKEAFTNENFTRFIYSTIYASKYCEEIRLQLFDFLKKISTVHRSIFTIVRERNSELHSIVSSNKKNKVLITKFLQIYELMIKTQDVRNLTFENSVIELLSYYGTVKGNEDIMVELLKLLITMMEKENHDQFLLSKKENFYFIVNIMNNPNNIKSESINKVFLDLLILISESEKLKGILTSSMDIATFLEIYFSNCLTQFLLTPLLPQILKVIENNVFVSEDIKKVKSSIELIFSNSNILYQNILQLEQCFTSMKKIALYLNDYLTNNYKDFLEIMDKIILYGSFQENKETKLFLSIYSLVYVISEQKVNAQNFNEIMFFLIKIIKDTINKNFFYDIKVVCFMIKIIVNHSKLSPINFNNILEKNSLNYTKLYRFFFSYLDSLNNDEIILEKKDDYKEIITNIFELIRDYNILPEDKESISNSLFSLFIKNLSPSSVSLLKIILEIINIKITNDDTFIAEFKKENKKIETHLKVLKTEYKSYSDSYLDHLAQEILTKVQQ